ncbi:hypothetical protein, partial [Carbonactinospora thermoautotrophica]|uniref:hypothetical protein n=1 Tax=Carbonactinospora thermoautotrophica TaxID=1469144 RepID=UPI001E4CB7B5
TREPAARFPRPDESDFIGSDFLPANRGNFYRPRPPNRFPAGQTSAYWLEIVLGISLFGPAIRLLMSGAPFEQLF